MPIDLERLSGLVIIYAIQFAAAVVVAGLGWWLASAVQRGARRTLLASSYVEPTLAKYLSSFARYAILVLTLLLILQILGIQATSLIAVVGAASLAIGLALQGTLSNIAAGVMLLLFRPFRLGDDIEVAGKRGIVSDLNLFMIELTGEDNVQILVPNNQVWNTAIINHSASKQKTIAEKIADSPIKPRS
jgi:small conductance mechanosensitive channel